LNARAAGLDGVELHCASGYLINQFLNAASNLRTDGFGGSPDKRAAFPAMVLARMAELIGPGRVGLRISPGNPYNGMDTADPEPAFAALLQAASLIVDPATRERLAYVHVIDMGLTDLDTLAMVRSNWPGQIIANNNLKADSARLLLQIGRAEAVSFGRAFIANPDLPKRMQLGAALRKPDFTLLYTGEERGYTDYPPL
jgi:N-ethylmaleimide reductase